MNLWGEKNLFKKIMHFLQRKSKQNTLPSYLQNHPKKILLEKAHSLFTVLYANVNSAEISRRDRENLLNDEDAFTCGEIQFLPFFAILDSIKPKPNEVFYDLGSGAGKAVFTAALCFDFSRVQGIEVLPGLSRLANAKLEQAQRLANNDTDLANKLRPIQFVQADFLNQDFSDGDVIFIAATCFNYATWDKLVNKLEALKEGARVVVTSKKITHAQFELMSESCELMSWGENSVFVYIKKNA